MCIRKVKTIDVPTNAMQSFHPHGYHLVMFKLDPVLFAIDKILEVELLFDNA